MSLSFEECKVSGYEKVVIATDESVGLKAILAIHNTRLGPALGGIRMYPYQKFDDALTDALRLAKGMTYKAALALCGTGGGKSVIIADPKKDKSRKLFLSFAEAVERLGGEYICAEDVGITPEDVSIIKEKTEYVVGLPSELSSGDPAPFTAFGTLRGIEASVKYVEGSSSLDGCVVAIQGLGSVGMALAELLFWRGARLVVADVSGEKTAFAREKYGAEVVSPQEIHTVACDVYSPCALGAVLNPVSIPQIKAEIVAGCANNQLLTEEDADALKRRGITYAPDFLINAGGLINVIVELEEAGYVATKAREKINGIYDQLLTTLDIAAQSKISTHAAAISLAEYRLKYGVGKRVEPVRFHHAGVIA